MRKQHCTYELRSRRVSQPVGCTTGVTETGSRPVGTNSEAPHENHGEQHAVPEPRTSLGSPLSGIDNTLYQPTESDLFEETANQQRSYVTDMMNSGSRLVGMNNGTSPDYLDMILPDSPLSGIDNTLYQPTESDLFEETANQQRSYVTDMMNSGSRLAGMNNGTSPDYLDMILPNLPEMLIEDDALLQVHHGFQSAVTSNSETALCSGADNILYQLAAPDFFPCSFNSPDSVADVPLPESFIARNENRDIFQESRQSLAIHQTDEGQQTPAINASLACGDKTASSSKPSSSEPRKKWRSNQKALVKELVNYAITAADIQPGERRRNWESVSTEIHAVFRLPKSQNSEDCILFQMVHLYKENLLPLWPMICEKDLEDPSNLHPVLFLVAVSAGAMYLDQNASVFGKMMHMCLRTSLITSFIEKEITELDTIWLAQARTTIQVVALYFGQGLELTYAQHLGAVLVTQSRRMNLFKRSVAEEFSGASTPEEQIEAWILAETRRRVAFGIVRADVFLSLLLNCPPSISADELEIGLPYPDHLWLSIGKLSPQELLAALERERMKRNETLFCDLIRIILDHDEALLNMEPRDYELVLFGLQQQVWKFSHDPDMFQRLIGHPWQEEGFVEPLDMDINLVFSDSAVQPRDHLQVSHREMRDLVLDRRRLSKALEKWTQSFNASRSRPGFNKDRASILSSLLLFHIYHLQLNACLDVLHHIADRRCNKMSIDHKRLQTAIRWAHNTQARNAVNHASKILSLLENEARLNPYKTARYTVLSFIGLYHSSVVLWTCFGASKPSGQLSFVPYNDIPNDYHYSRSHEILMSIVFLYQRLKRMSWDTFSGSVRRLSCHHFPRDHS
ncbi:uncharacterized protein A1O9_09909 [Exophiala aquamarina CBS 119918]|uniref:Xylanolytic transcriptional activator regulatory domain-containing protein n=1 Tax=Exophiala aquamarina CBS 119918 TaxID=1182545 RepID=A0A072P1V8_9EURO|nr:uncharacterized protein A1O9_09909 [Exophiala aquamarina CBS 119918]KEF54114.1 hypothetical protein A1O9_09909 [Exophiala aquamarina CBS 119918]